MSNAVPGVPILPLFHQASSSASLEPELCSKSVHCLSTLSVFQSTSSELGEVFFKSRVTVTETVLNAILELAVEDNAEHIINFSFRLY